MAEALGRILQDIQAMLDRHEAKLGVRFRQLGADPRYDRAFLADLSDSCRRLPPLAGAARRAFDAHRLNAYSAVQGTLGQLHKYVDDVVAQGSGSEDNTRHALTLLAAAQAALGRLMALMDVVDRAGKGGAPPQQHPPDAPKEATPPTGAEASPDMPPPHPQPPNAAEKTAPPTSNMTPQELAERLAKKFSNDEMKDLAFKVGLVVDDLPKDASRFTMARSLVEIAERRGMFSALVEKALQERPALFL